jgi:hypothetical protein
MTTHRPAAPPESDLSEYDRYRLAVFGVAYQLHDSGSGPITEAAIRTAERILFARWLVKQGRCTDA